MPMTKFCDQCSRHFSGGFINSQRLKYRRGSPPKCLLCYLIHYMMRFARSLGYEASRSYEILIHRLVSSDSSAGLLSLVEHQWPRNKIMGPELVDTIASRPEFSIFEKYLEVERVDSQPPEFEMNCSRSVILQSRIPRPIGEETSSWPSRPRYAKSKASLNQVQHWIETCCQHHGLCQVSQQRLKLAQRDRFSSPIRLIQVEDSETVPKLRLVPITSDVPKFVTLSHRWPKDSAHVLQTKKANLDAHFTSIPFSRLPETFQNAIDFARAIGIYHLWIDSICIVQDDQEDWEVHSRHMGSIFRLSFCTFAATDARSLNDIDDGLFSDSDSPVSILLQNKFSYRYDDAYPAPDDASKMIYKRNGRGIDINEKSVSAWRKLDVTVRPNLSSFHTLIELSDWNRRGWILQERVLSTRILHFTREQIFWECAEQVASEQSPTHEPSSLRSTESPARLQAILREFISKNDYSDTITRTNYLEGKYSKVWIENQKFEVWWRLLEAYSTCHLTFESDKWYAVAGLSTLLKEIFHDEIHYGIWSGAVGAGILWSARNEALQRYENYNSPSWSWLGVKGSVRYQYQDNAYTGYIQKVRPLYQSSFIHQGKGSVSSASSDPAANGSELTLSCPIKAAKVSPRRFSDFVFKETSGRHQQDLPAWEFFDKITHGVSQLELTKEYRSQNLPPRTALLLGEEGRAIGWVIMDFDNALTEMSITCAAILERVLQNHWTKDQQLIEFIALEPDATNKNHYRRIGRGRIVEYNLLESFSTEQIHIV